MPFIHTHAVRYSYEYGTLTWFIEQEGLFEKYLRETSDEGVSLDDFAMEHCSEEFKRYIEERETIYKEMEARGITVN